jgi:hypothetical protein
MKRIGKTDQGGILLEMTEDDITRFRQACDALADLLVQGANHGIVIEDESHRDEAPGTFEATLIGGTRLPDGAIKARTFKPRKNNTAKGTVSIGGCPSKKACELCGKMFEPPRKDSRLCSKACTDKDWRQRKQGKVKPVSVAKCLSCGRPFEPKRRDQTCCSKACRKKLPRPVKARKAKEATVVKAPPPVAVVAKPAQAASGKADRLALIKRLANKGVGVPAFVERAGTSPNLEDITEYQSARRMAAEGRDS